MNGIPIFTLITLLVIAIPLRLFADPIQIQQNSKINIVNFYKDGGSIENIRVRQSGDTNILVNNRANGSQELNVVQSGKINYVNSRQISVKPGQKSVNITIVAQSGGGVPVTSTQSTYVETPINSGYLSEFINGDLSIVNFGPAGSVSDIGRAR